MKMQAKMFEEFCTDIVEMFSLRTFQLKVYMKWKLSLSYLKELLKWWRNSIYSFSISLFVLEILRFVSYVNNTLHTSHCITSCWETMYMIEIILLNQSKLSLLGVIRQIPLHAQFRVTLFDNSNDISTFTTTHYTMWRMQCVIYISNKSQYLKNEERYCKTIDGVPLSRVLSNKTNLIFISCTL